MNGFSTDSFRDFKQYIGELTATAAGIQIAVYKTTDLISDDKRKNDPWAELAVDYDIKVDGLKSERVLSSAARLNVVSIYSGFDLYLDSFRKQYNDLTGNEWVADKSDTPFDQLYKNLERFKMNLKDEVRDSRRIAIDYYRLSRNAIVHPSSENKRKAVTFYEKHTASFKEVRALYKMRSAPNSYDALDFHDVKLFARILLDVLPIFDIAVDPGDEKLGEFIPDDHRIKDAKSDALKKRLKNKAKGYLIHTFGVSNERADKIYELTKAH